MELHSVCCIIFKDDFILHRDHSDFVAITNIYSHLESLRGFILGIVIALVCLVSYDLYLLAIVLT